MTRREEKLHKYRVITEFRVATAYYGSMVFCFRRNSLLDSARRRAEINKLRRCYYYYKSYLCSPYPAFVVAFGKLSYLGKPQHSHGPVQCVSRFYLTTTTTTTRRQMVSRAHRFSYRHAVASRGRIRPPPPPSGFHTRRRVPRRRRAQSTENPVSFETGDCSRTHAHARRSTRRTRAGRAETTLYPGALKFDKKKQRPFIPRE